MIPYKLAEMNAWLVGLLPSLFGFAVVRWPTWIVAEKCVRIVAPRSALALLLAVRAAVLVSVFFLMIAMTAYAPPSGVCEPYTAQRPQGACGLLSLLCLFLSNRTLATALALSALQAVAHTSSAALPLVCAAVAAAISVPRGTLLYSIVFTHALTHAIYCHSDEHSEGTYGSVLGALTLSALFGYHLAIFQIRLAISFFGAPAKWSSRLLRRLPWRRTYRNGPPSRRPAAAGAAAAETGAASPAAPAPAPPVEAAAARAVSPGPARQYRPLPSAAASSEGSAASSASSSAPGHPGLGARPRRRRAAAAAGAATGEARCGDAPSRLPVHRRNTWKSSPASDAAVVAT